MTSSSSFLPSSHPTSNTTEKNFGLDLLLPPPNSLLFFSPRFLLPSSAEEKKRGQSCFSPPSPMGGRRRRRWEKEEGEEKSLFGGFVAATALALGLGLRGRFGSGGRAEGNAGGLPNKVCRSRTWAMSTNVRKSSIVPKKKGKRGQFRTRGMGKLNAGVVSFLTPSFLLLQFPESLFRFRNPNPPLS